MANRFGLTGADVVVDLFGNVQTTTATLHATEADATGNANVIATVTITAGRWTYTHATLTLVWLRLLDGTVWPIPSVDATIAANAAIARTPDQIITGTITRDANGALTSASVTWPDGKSGTYTADTVSTSFPGAVDGYHITHGSPVTQTYTQPTVTRDATGAVTTLPAIVVT